MSTSFWNDRDAEFLLAIIRDDIDIRHVDIFSGPDGYGREWMFASEADRRHGKSW